MEMVAVAASRALDERANKDIVRRHFHHPVALLCFLSFVSMLNYYDRGAFAGSLSFIKEDLNLSNDEAGLLGSAFIGTAPLSAHIPINSHIFSCLKPATQLCLPSWRS